MTTKQRLQRSHTVKDSDSSHIKLQACDEDIVALKKTNRIVVDPIWQTTIDDFEGPLYQKYIASNPQYTQIYLRPTVRDMLDFASQMLPDSLSLVVRAAHRPLAVQQALLDMLCRQHKIQNPNASEQDSLEYARIYVSDPTIKLPPHCCGAAVDVDILNTNTGELLDFGCPVNTDNPVAFLHSSAINKTQKDNRLVLLTAMLSAGFASLSNEWWHYSYGDAVWANFYMQPYALYGLIEPKLTNHQG